MSDVEMTPIVAVTLDGAQMLAKYEGAQLTGSFKDRGARLLVRWARQRGIKQLVIDSSGNAGAALAAWAARSDLGCRVFAPQANSPAKLAQAQAYGARVDLISGDRQAVELAALAEHSASMFYASHLWSPVFLMGTATCLIEAIEQLDGALPTWLICPAGGGILLLGSALALQAAVQAGRIERAPRLLAVQSESCTPIARAWGLEIRGDAVAEVIAEGIQIAKPPRLREIIHAVRSTDGKVTVVKNQEVIQAARDMARTGVFVELTSAAAIAGWRRLRESEEGPTDALVLLTATGLKTAGRFQALALSGAQERDRPQ